jgi:hypothetical protein
VNHLIVDADRDELATLTLADGNLGEAPAGFEVIPGYDTNERVRPFQPAVQRTLPLIARRNMLREKDVHVMATEPGEWSRRLSRLCLNG